MTTITDGLITEADRLVLVNAIIERGNASTTHQLVALALKLGVAPETLEAAAQWNDDCALAETEVSARVRGCLSECG